MMASSGKNLTQNVSARPRPGISPRMGREGPAFYYNALATFPDGQPIAETFTSSGEYLPGDELPLKQRPLAGGSVERQGTRSVQGEEKLVRVLRCRLV